MKTLMLAATAALMPLAAAAHDGMAVNDAYARSANPQTGAAFMLLENHSETDCTLASAASPVAERVELHTHKEEGGVMKMMQIEGGLTIPAQDVHELARGGDHIMFMGLKDKWENGGVVPLTLDFGDCGTVEVEVTVDNDRQPGTDTKATTDHATH